eukprot:TRINITY_DN10831_c0_g1_i17.p1 TRINITY_DN10831_c0_g1~~TRINITY_DN10831_c0_g1_i17.p1  ORF type:complete len:103 (-),score=1.74 TRINITY_DN10831_c0_g1_i17:347-655(-)
MEKSFSSFLGAGWGVGRLIGLTHWWSLVLGNLQNFSCFHCRALFVRHLSIQLPYNTMTLYSAFIFVIFFLSPSSKHAFLHTHVSALHTRTNTRTCVHAHAHT